MRGILSWGGRKAKTAGLPYFFSFRDNEFAVERDGTISMSKNSKCERKKKRCNKSLLTMEEK